MRLAFQGRTQTRLLCGLLWGLLGGHPEAQAHLMPPQQGTLNLVDGSAHLVLSLPVSALRGVDDDGDGRLSSAELHAHSRAIQQQLGEGLQWVHGAQVRRPEGVLINLSPEDDAPDQPARQLLVMGRFSGAAAEPAARLRIMLFGRTDDEARYTITLAQAGVRGPTLLFTPDRSVQAARFGAPSSGMRQAATTPRRVQTGAVQLLVLMVVVIVASWAWRRARRRSAVAG